jgi:hypothetical protein
MIIAADGGIKRLAWTFELPQPLAAALAADSGQPCVAKRFEIGSLLSATKQIATRHGYGVVNGSCKAVWE